MRYVVTGANRGIGLEITRQLLARGDEVIATARDPKQAMPLVALGGKLTVEACDVSDATSVRAFSARVEGVVDVLVNNAGIGGAYDAIESVDLERCLEIYNTNAVGALRVTQALLPQLRRGTTRKLVHVSSGMGSIADNTSGGAYAYRMSKAALNMASRSLAADLRAEKFISVVINPGWVKTDMGGSGAPLAVEDSARGVIARIDALSAKDSGEFLNHDGQKHWPF